MNKDIKSKQSAETSKPGKKKGVRFDETSQRPRPGYGLLLLRYLLSHSLNKAMLLKKNMKQLEDIKDILQNYIPIIETSNVEDNPDKVDLEGHHEILASAWTMLLQMEMLLHLNKKDQNNDEITVTAEKHLAWISDKILAKKQSTTFTSYIIKSAIMFCSNMVTMNICNSTFADLAAQLSSDFVDQGMKIN